MFDPVSLKIFALCTVVLFFKMVAVAFGQGLIRKRVNAYTLPEDAAFLGKTQPVPQEHPDMMRINNALRNDLENIPLFLVLGLLYLHLQGWHTGALIYFPLFTLARCGHSFFYLRGQQPWRSICYGLGLLCNIALSVHILIGALKL